MPAKKPRPLKKKLNENQFYCVACRKAMSCKHEDIKLSYVKNSKAPSKKVPVLRGTPKCEHKVIKFVSRDSVPELKKKYKSK